MTNSEVGLKKPMIDLYLKLFFKNYSLETCSSTKTATCSTVPAAAAAANGATARPAAAAADPAGTTEDSAIPAGVAAASSRTSSEAATGEIPFLCSAAPAAMASSALCAAVASEDAHSSETASIGGGALTEAEKVVGNEVRREPSRRKWEERKRIMRKTELWRKMVGKI